MNKDNEQQSDVKIELTEQEKATLHAKFPNLILEGEQDTRPPYQKMYEQSSMNIHLEYPFNDQYEYTTMLKKINFDKRRVHDIKTGVGFIITEPQGIKKDVKNQEGIFSRHYGSNSSSDADSFNGVYRCDCGMIKGAIHHGEYCEDCDSYVRYIGDDISKTGYLVLKDKYWIIHPNIYRTLEAFIGVHRLNRIIEPRVDVDSDGKELPLIQTKKDEPFAGIGILEFRERYEEILQFYLSCYPAKKVYYDDLMLTRDIAFTHTISVYSSLLRPSKIDEASLKYESLNEYFNLLANLVYKVNRDRLRMDKKRKEKWRLLYDIQVNLNEAYLEIKNILAKKRGDIRSAIG